MSFSWVWRWHLELVWTCLSFKGRNHAFHPCVPGSYLCLEASKWVLWGLLKLSRLTREYYAIEHLICFHDWTWNLTKSWAGNSLRQYQLMTIDKTRLTEIFWLSLSSHFLVWWRCPELIWQGCCQSRDSFAIRQKTEGKKLRPLYLHTRGYFKIGLAIYRRQIISVRQLLFW